MSFLKYFLGLSLERSRNLTMGEANLRREELRAAIIAMPNISLCVAGVLPLQDFLLLCLLVLINFRCVFLVVEWF